MENIQKKFEAIGARLVVRPLRRQQFQRSPRTFDLDVSRDKAGEHFVLRTSPEMPELRVLQANRANRHLLLHAAGDEGGERFLCGHDERHWFVAGIAARVSTVTAAKAALLPTALQHAGLTPDDLARRRNGAFVRQGEWFFLPVSRDLSKYPIHRMEPLVRGRGSKPHYVDELIRFGGQEVFLAQGREFTPTEWAAVRATDPKAFAHRLVKDPEVFVRGAVRHPDHATIMLVGWHSVHPNAEARSANVSFYD